MYMGFTIENKFNWEKIQIHLVKKDISYRRNIEEKRVTKQHRYQNLP